MASFVLSFTDKWSHTPTFISDLRGRRGVGQYGGMDLTFNYLELRIWTTEWNFFTGYKVHYKQLEPGKSMIPQRKINLAISVTFW